jgi:hypothetical protein
MPRDETPFTLLYSHFMLPFFSLHTTPESSPGTALEYMLFHGVCEDSEEKEAEEILTGASRTRESS